MCHRGKFGQVFKLVEKATKKVWAGKFIKAYSAKEKENVRQEIGIMNSLHHPKLVQCIDAFEGKSDIVMVLEMYVTHYTAPREQTHKGTSEQNHKRNPSH